MTSLVWSERACPACGFRVRLVRNGACGVVRLVRAEWAKACPLADSLGERASCPHLQRAFASRAGRTNQPP